MTLEALNLALERNLRRKSAIQIYSRHQVRYLTIDPLHGPVTGTKSHMLVSKLHSGTSKTMQHRTSPP